MFSLFHPSQHLYVHNITAQVDLLHFYGRQWTGIVTTSVKKNPPGHQGKAIIIIIIHDCIFIITMAD